MALVDGLADIRIPAHEFSAAALLWALGEITRQNVIDVLGLEAGDEAQLDELSTFYGGLTATNKAGFHGRLEAANIALQGGYITKAKYQSLLGMT